MTSQVPHSTHLQQHFLSNRFQPESTNMATSNLRTPWQDRAEFEKLLGRQADVQDVIAQLQNALAPENLRKASNYGPDWTRYGYAAVDPGTKEFVDPTLYKNKQYIGPMQKQLSSALSEDAINQAALELFSPYTPPAAKPLKYPTSPRPRVPVTTKLPVLGISGVIGVLLDLLSYSADTNAGEDKRLKDARGLEFTNRPEYEALLQQAIQSGNATPPK